MSTEEIPLGPLVVGIDGLELNTENRSVLMHPAVGGVILFSRNYQSPDQLRALTAEIRSLRSPRLLVAAARGARRGPGGHAGEPQSPGGRLPGLRPAEKTTTETTGARRRSQDQ